MNTDKTLLIKKVLAGDASVSERQALQDWLKESDANQEEFDCLKLLWDKGGPQSAVPEDLSDPFYNGFYQIKHRIEKRQMKRSRRQRLQTAAMLLAFVCMAIYVITLTSPPRRMAFHGDSLDHVLHTLQKTHSITVIVVQQELLSCPFTGVFYGDINNNEIIHSLADALGLNYTVLRTGTYQLEGRGCSN